MASTIIVSFSELDTFRQCPLKHVLGYKERWTQPTKSPALNRGTLWHLVSATHYGYIKECQDAKTPVDSTELAKRVAKVLATCGDERDLLYWMYDRYVQQYGIEDDPKTQRVLAVEWADELWLPTDRGGRSRFKLKVKIDLIVRDSDGIWIWDHKSCKELPKEKELDIDDQFGLYTFLLRMRGKEIVGSVHNAARTQRNKGPMALDASFLRSRMYRTDKELNSIAIDAYRTARAAYSGYADYSSPDPDRCGWRCDFLSPHLLMRKTGKPSDVILPSFGFKQDSTRH